MRFKVMASQQSRFQTFLLLGLFGCVLTVIYGESGFTPFSDTQHIQKKNVQEKQKEDISHTNAFENNVSEDTISPGGLSGQPPSEDTIPAKVIDLPGRWVAERPNDLLSLEEIPSDTPIDDPLGNNIGRHAPPDDGIRLTDAPDDVRDHTENRETVHTATQPNDTDAPDDMRNHTKSQETIRTATQLNHRQEDFEKTVFEKRILVRPGDTLSMVLTAAGVAKEDTNATVTALQQIFNPKHLRPGYSVDLTLKANQNPNIHLITKQNNNSNQGLRLQKATIQTGPLSSIIIEHNGISFLASLSEQEVRREERRLSGVIFNSLSQAAHQAKVPATVIGEMIDAYSYDVDFQRDIRREDRFEVMYEEHFIGDQPVPGTAKLIHASLELSGQRSHLYRFRPAQGEDGFYNENGQGVRKALLRTPVNGARLSSRYGMRKHPILGYNRMHRGVDFAAPTGTPIYAAGNGVVRKAQYNGNYGHYIEIKHNERFSTAYAHLSRYAKGVKAGAHVRQGQIIGYVGSTGLSSGPHLHFEVRRNNKSINPLSVQLPAAEKLSDDDLQLFKKRIADIQQRYANLEKKTAVVSQK